MSIRNTHNHYYSIAFLLSTIFLPAEGNASSGGGIRIFQVTSQATSGLTTNFFINDKVDDYSDHVIRMKAARKYIGANYQQIMRDASIGGGDYSKTLFEMSMFQDDISLSCYNQLLKSQFSLFFQTQKTPKLFFEQLSTEIESFNCPPLTSNSTDIINHPAAS